MERYSSQFPSVKKEYEVWVDSIFGHKIERTSEGRRDVLRLQVQMNLDIALDPSTLQCDRNVIWLNIFLIHSYI